MTSDDISKLDKFAELRKRAGSILDKKCDSLSEILSENLLNLIEEFNTYQIELELQNEELRKTQIALEQSQKKYRDLFKYAPVGYLTLNSKGIITSVNLTCCDWLATDKSNILDKKLPDFILPEDQDIYYFYYKQLFSSQQKHTCTLRLKTNDEGFIYVKLTSTHNLDKKSSLGEGCITMAVTDISQLMEYESELKSNAEKYKAMADFASDWEYWVDPEGKLQYVSPSSEQFTGYTANEFMQHPEYMTSIVHPDHVKRINHHMEHELKNNNTIQFDYKIITKEGAVKWVSHLCQPIYGNDGEFIGRNASIRDITVRKKLETKLQDQRKRLRAALDASSDGVWDINLSTGEEYRGRNWFKALGYSEKDANEKKLQWKLLVRVCP